MGDQVKELHPEWWGARSLTVDPTVDSTEALEQCLRAARVERPEKNSGDHSVLPVILQGRYGISNTFF